MGKVSRNAIYLTVEKGAHLSGGLLIMVAVARLMGTEGLAVYGFVISLTAFFVPILDLGLSNRIIGTVAARGEKAEETVSDAIGFKLGLAPVVLALTLGGAWACGKTSAALVAVGLICGSTVAMSVGDSVNAIFKGLQRSAYSALLVGGLNLLLFLTCLGAIRLGWGLVGIAVCYLICRLGYLYSGLALIARVARDLRPRLRADPVRANLVTSGLRFTPAVYFLGNLLHVNFLTTDLALGKADSGPFFIAYRLAAALLILASGSLEAIYSGLAARFEVPADIKPVLARAVLSLLGIGLGVVAVVHVAARPVTLWVFGDAFESSVEIIRLVAWTLPPFLLCGLAHAVLLVMRQEGLGAILLVSLLAGGALLGGVANGSWGPLGTAVTPSAITGLFAVILWVSIWPKLR